jgi:XTP/dITP diphosphohydrolase
MARWLDPGPLLIATHNVGKLREIAALVGPLGFTAHSAAELGLIEPEETGVSFIENARIKALAAATAARLPALADDSGLEVTVLGGAPGIHSARWAGPERDFATGMTRIHEAMEEAGGEDEDDTARFVCALALCWPDGHCETVEGEVKGRFVWPPRGVHGFGYDPIFIADGQTETFGEMAPAAKHAISHRADAFAKMCRLCLAPAP